MYRLVLALLLALTGHVALAQVPGTAHPNPVYNQAQCAVTVTPSDSGNTPAAPALCAGFPPKALYTAGTAGGAACVLSAALADGAQIVYSNVQPGSYMPIWVSRVYATGTTCTGLVLWF